MATIKHLESKFSIASYELIKVCDGDELRFYLWLKLWAINKHSAFPSYKIICDDLGIGMRTLPRLIEKMEQSGRLKIERNHRKNNIYDITGYDELINSSVPNLPSTTAESAVSSVPNLPSNDQKETKRNITSKIPATVVAKETLECLNGFIPINGSREIIFGRPNQKQAMERLIKTFGREPIEKIIAFLPTSNATPYAPRVTTPIQLESKMGELKAFWQQEKNKQKSKTKFASMPL